MKEDIGFPLLLIAAVFLFISFFAEAEWIGICAALFSGASIGATVQKGFLR